MKRVLSSVILFILIIQIISITLATEVVSVTIDMTDEEMLEYDKNLQKNTEKKIKEQLEQEECLDNEFENNIEEVIDTEEKDIKKVIGEAKDYEQIIGVTGDDDNEEENYNWLNENDLKVEFEIDYSSQKMNVTGIPVTYNNYLSVNIYEENTSDAKIIENEMLLKVESEGKCTVKLSERYMALNKKYYYKIVEKQKGTSVEKVISNSYKEVERTLPKLGTRLDVYMFTENKSTPMQKLYYTSTIKDRKMNYKIGKIDDLNLLRKFQTDEEQAFKDLYEYATKDKGLTTGKFDKIYEEVNFNPASKITTSKNEYYYAYLQMDDEEGKYYPIDDVAIYTPGIDQTLLHFAFASMQFNSTKLEDPTASGSKYPFTGKVAIGTGIVLLIGATYILYRKNKSYNDVK